MERRELHAMLTFVLESGAVWVGWGRCTATTSTRAERILGRSARGRRRALAPPAQMLRMRQEQGDLDEMDALLSASSSSKSSSPSPANRALMRYRRKSARIKKKISQTKGIVDFGLVSDVLEDNAGARSDLILEDVAKELDSYLDAVRAEIQRAKVMLDLSSQDIEQRSEVVQDPGTSDASGEALPPDPASSIRELNILEGMMRADQELVRAHLESARVTVQSLERKSVRKDAAVQDVLGQIAADEEDDFDFLSSLS
ncbi:hypothetical protein FVE85_7502 [Porphyridium purpureum]|uniref:Uncharacterized protein n=1 Tax=Porphyridium purpureum TaxID=35688 RepID=A0A5J4ZB84_PORPP|nr:hypothetical protein FVE85_7502 [Porphyridium purpureum]|eukprot:POR5369..scf295_1